MRFSKDSFTSEITTKEEARASYTYLMQNSLELQSELEKGHTSYDEINQFITQLWRNLCQSCERVGYTNHHLEEVKVRLQSAK